ncbi:hypothetical protein [Planctomyces sp. SH-PL14]|uniref:hypothetical protein n=1 Tax=Planctomyces sp. SH-PL14 TaxID=1632864 RepID=UPI0012E72DDE|nr:hypothetical protein [Planctomyces sp. SH-PL14]
MTQENPWELKLPSSGVAVDLTKFGLSIDVVFPFAQAVTVALPLTPTVFRAPNGFIVIRQRQSGIVATEVGIFVAPEAIDQLIAELRRVQKELNDDQGTGASSS